MGVSPIRLLHHVAGRFLQRRVWIVILFCLALAGCPWSDNDRSDARSVTISGTVQKGLFSDLNVTAYDLESETGTRGEPWIGDVDLDSQSYAVTLEADELILLQATGSFTSDTTGETVVLDKPLYAIVTNEEASTGDPVNINLATTLQGWRTLDQLEDWSGTTEDLLAADEAFVNEVLGFPDGTDASSLDYGDITATSDLSDPDLQLLLFSGAVTQSLESEFLYAGGFGMLVDGTVEAIEPSDTWLAYSTLDGVSADGTYTLTQQNSGYDLPELGLSGGLLLSCTPEGACAWTSSPSLTVSLAPRLVREADAGAWIAVRLGQLSDVPVAVRVYTEPVTAGTGIDFAPVDTVVEVPAGALQTAVPVPVIVDALAEADEAFLVWAEVLTEGWTSDGRAADVVIRDALPGAADTRDATALRVIDLCATAAGPAATTVARPCPVGGDPSLPYQPAPDSVLAITLDAAADCAAGADCPAQRDEWVARLVLVARDSLGANRVEEALGPYIYPGAFVQRLSESPLPRGLLASLGAERFALLAEQALQNGWSMHLEARFGGQPSVTAARQLAPLVPVPDTLLAGDLKLPIGAIDRLDPFGGSVCTGGGYVLNAEFVTAVIGDQSASIAGTVCVQIDSSGTTPVARLVEGELSLAGVAVALPSDVGYIPPELPGGVRRFSGLVVIPAAGSEAGYVHADGWPFRLRIVSGALTPAGIELGYSDGDYLFGLHYSSQDPRASGQRFSNDAFYDAPLQPGSLLLTASGLQGLVSLGAGQGRSAFPKARLAWQPFSSEIVDSALSGPASISFAINMQQSAACRLPDCRADTPVKYSATASGVLDGRGFLLAQGAAASAAMPAWGARPDGSFAFARPADVPAGQTLQVALPGFRMPGTAPSAGAYLLAHLATPPPGTEIPVHPPGTRAYLDGNHFPTGISIGPEYYVGTGGAPEVGTAQNLAGRALEIDNQSDRVSLSTSIGAKFVARNAGVTGVFNVDPSALVSPVSFYGYPLELERFAIRLTDNELDSYSWIDGRLALKGDLGGPGGLPLYFSGMEMNCAGRLANANLAWEACDRQDNDGDGVIDENCDRSLFSWRAPAEIYAARFSSALSCSTGAQQFVLEHDLEFAALDRPVALTTTWNPSGRLLEPSVAGVLSAYRLDRRPDVADSGFSLRPDSASLKVANVAGGREGRYGWLEFPATKVGVPFWDALGADVRVANGGNGAEPSVVVPGGRLADLGADATNEAVLAEAKRRQIELPARYTWGNTGFSFELPVSYQPWQNDVTTDEDAAGRQSRFIGRPQAADLFVMDVVRGINFIEPTRTKLSFGVSANVEELAGASFQLDLDNPENLGRVDDFLVDVGVLDAPVLESTFRDLQESVFVLNRLANRGLEDLMRQGLEASLEEIGRAAADVTPDRKDPFVSVSAALGEINSYPQQVATLLEELLQSPLQDAVADLAGELRSRITALEAALNALGQGQDAAADVLAALADVRRLVGSLRRVTIEAEAAVDGAIEEARVFVAAVRDPVARLRAGLVEVDGALLSAVSFVNTTCSIGFLPDAENNGYLQEAMNRFASVREILGFLEGTDALVPLAELLDDDPEFRRRFRDMQASIQRQAEELGEYLAAADAAIRGQVCSEDVNNVVSRALSVTAQLDSQAGAIEAQLNDVDGVLANLQVTVAQGIGPIRAVVEQTDQVFAWLASELEGPLTRPGAELVATMNSHIKVITGDASFVLVARNESERDIVTVATELVSGQLGGVFTALRAELAAVGSGLPAAYYTPEQLRRLLVNEVMASAPVRELRQLMNVHLEELGLQAENLVFQLTDQVNLALRNAVAGLESEVNGLLDSARASVRSLPIDAAGIDGFAVIKGNELERVHIGAEWRLGGIGRENGAVFNAALDAYRWGAENGIGSCGISGGASRLDVVISAYGLPLSMGPLSANLTAEKLYLGFTLDPSGQPLPAPALVPKGLFGGIDISGGIGFGPAEVRDPALVAGIGDVQNYLGASADAVFSNLEAEVAFLFGKICPGNEILAALDPEAERFVTVPPSGFAGAYLRGGASIPLIPGGCWLNASARADFGAWILAGTPTTFGGLIGGAAYGEIACAGALRGQILTLGERLGNGRYRYLGSAFGVAGGGFDCDPGTWTSVARSRRDAWCGTGDAQFSAEYNDGWKFSPPEVDAIF